VDVGLSGIGENTHIAFNDPPADFDDPASYKTVTLDAACRAQQFREGWFASMDDVPAKAVSMTVREIMKCKAIISAVPYAVKADAVKAALEAETPTPYVPASILKTHPDFRLFLDRESSSKLSEDTLNKCAFF
jgi:glucosamine-6-phosphate deaminase